MQRVTGASVLINVVEFKLGRMNEWELCKQANSSNPFYKRELNSHSQTQLTHFIHKVLVEPASSKNEGILYICKWREFALGVYFCVVQTWLGC